MFKKHSKIYEIDLTQKIRAWIDSFKDDLELLNAEIFMVGERMVHASYAKQFSQAFPSRKHLIGLPQQK